MPRSFATIQYLQGTPPGVTGAAPGGITVNGNGQAADMLGLNGGSLLEIQELNGGSATATVQINGSFDGITWYACGYQQVDATAAPARAIAAISVTAGAKHVYQILDNYPQLQAVVSAVALGATLLIRSYGSSDG